MEKTAGQLEAGGGQGINRKEAFKLSGMKTNFRPDFTLMILKSVLKLEKYYTDRFETMTEIIYLRRIAK